ncbi:hypothetical protein CEXT_322081 [Caerostris extrusa]|uniref:EGF-like domain-containing protein n=1 Tax=Caerostris extrusa TaxID=172846 RepID=A0AAV4VB51_CAEEX|nr:hypothetical protein CEXT_322081 [Caerostris extrusa]
MVRKSVNATQDSLKTREHAKRVTVVVGDNVVSKMVQKSVNANLDSLKTKEPAKACDCGRNGQCSFVNGAKKCQCDAGFLEDQGACKGHDCGKYSYYCYLDTMDRKLCLCHFGYLPMNAGYCYGIYLALDLN